MTPTDVDGDDVDAVAQLSRSQGRRSTGRWLRPNENEGKDVAQVLPSANTPALRMVPGCSDVRVDVRPSRGEVDL